MAYSAASFTPLQATTFESALYHLVEVKRSKLAPTAQTVLRPGHPSVTIRRVDKVSSAAERTTPWQALAVNPMSFSSVVVTPKTIGDAIGFDSLDLAKSDIMDPAGLAASKISANFARVIDDTLVAALLGTTTTDTGTEDLGAGQIIGTAGAPTTGLTADLIDDALKSMALAGVDLEMVQLFCAMGPEGTKSMFKNRSTFATLELGRTVDQVSGAVGTYRGVTFIESNSVTEITADVEARAILYTSSALKRGANHALRTDVTDAKHLAGIGHVLVKAEMSVSGVRMDVAEVRDIRFDPAQ